jgi:hypothetical protein
MLVVQGSLDVIDSRIRHPTALEDLQPLLRRLLTGDILDHPIDVGAMFHSITVCDETNVGLPLGIPKAIGQHAEQAVVAATEKNVTIGGLVASVWYNRCYRVLAFANRSGACSLTVRRAPASRIFLAANKRRGGQVRQCRDLAVTEAGINMLAPASPTSSNQSSHDSIRCIEAGG